MMTTLSQKSLQGRIARFGVYSSEWEKPTSLDRVIRTRKVLENVKFESTGFTAVMSNYDGIKREGLNYEMTVDIGLDNSMGSEGYKIEDELGEDYSLTYNAIKLDLSFKWSPIVTESSRLAIIGGGYIDYKAWGISYTPEGSSSNDEGIELEADTLYKLYGSINYRFAM